MTRRDNVRSQLEAFAALGYVRWQPAIHGRWAITPAGGTLLLLNLREAELFVSGLATGSTSPSAEERRRRMSSPTLSEMSPEQREQIVNPPPPDEADPVIFAEKLDAAERLLHDAEQYPAGVDRIRLVIEGAAKLKRLRTVLRDHPLPLELTERTAELSNRARTALDL